MQAKITKVEPIDWNRLQNYTHRNKKMQFCETKDSNRKKQSRKDLKQVTALLSHPARVYLRKITNVPGDSVPVSHTHIHHTVTLVQKVFDYGRLCLLQCSGDF